LLRQKMLDGGLDQQFHGDPSLLPLAFNLLRNTCKAFRNQTRGLELRFDQLVYNVWNSESFCRLEDFDLSNMYFKKAWYLNARQVILVGKFTIHQTPDKNIRHSIIRVGSLHPDAFIHVRVHELKLYSEPTKKNG
jgi:hypothetical protein